jgi:4-amino-4-deoxy-L-arabinose transferase-like glycosyltransferase
MHDAADNGEMRPTKRAAVAVYTQLADWWLLGAVVLALVMRVVAWRVAPHAELLGDEREYYSAAAILADGRGFAFVDQGLWVRAPLYIVVLGGIFRLFGPEMLPVWVMQTGLGLATIALVYLLARLCYERRAVARLAAVLCAVYLPFAAYAGLLLSETLFTVLLLVAFVGLTWHARRGGWVSLAAAGAALGAGALTRGSALPFLAAVLVWALALTGWRDWRGAAWRTVLVVGVALAVIAPWSARNLVVYKAIIPVETTGGYNFWLGAMGGRNAGQIEATLREIPNQGERQSTAWARGWAVVRDDPARFAAKAAKEAGDLWRLNFGAFERLVRGYGLGKVPPLWLGLTFALDDLLYIVALPLAVLGWCQWLRREDRWLFGLWLGYNCATAAIFFAINRFRLPLMPILLLLAARGAVALVEWWRAGRDFPWGRPRRWLAPAVMAIALVAIVLLTLAPDQYVVGARRWADAERMARGYALLRSGEAQEALATFERLPAEFYPRSTALAAAYHKLGQDERALATLDDERDPMGATLLRGEIFRAQGRADEAFKVFNQRDVRIANPTEEAWARLDPPPLSRLDVGDGLNLGYVHGMNLDERDPDGTTYRWTEGRAEVWLEAPGGGEPVWLALRVRGYRPNGTLPELRVSVNGQVVGTVAVRADWQTAQLALPAITGRVVVRLETPTFVPGYADQRQLGVMLDWVEVSADNR